MDWRRSYRSNGRHYNINYSKQQYRILYHRIWSYWFAPDQNIENEGPWAATINFTLNGGTTGVLSSIAFDYKSLTNSGTDQGSAATRLQNFDILVNGVVYDTQMQTLNQMNGSLTFTAAGLTTGFNTITITASSGFTTGNNIGIDNLVVNGELVAIPEPSSTALLGLGGLALILRRRK